MSRNIWKEFLSDRENIEILRERATEQSSYVYDLYFLLHTRNFKQITKAGVSGAIVELQQFLEIEKRKRYID